MLGIYDIHGACSPEKAVECSDTHEINGRQMSCCAIRLITHKPELLGDNSPLCSALELGLCSHNNVELLPFSVRVQFGMVTTQHACFVQ
jgi:hypothetical protein